MKHQKKQKKIKKNISDINEIVKGGRKSEEETSAIKKILKHFTNNQKKLSNSLMNILKLYLKLNIKQNMGKVSKY